MFAIVKFSGRQYRVEEKQVIKTEKVPYEEGKTFDVGEVLLTHNKETVIGKPLVEGAKVTFKVKRTARSEKIRVFKMKAKKRYKRTKGHRQYFSELEVVKITA